MDQRGQCCGLLFFFTLSLSPPPTFCWCEVLPDELADCAHAHSVHQYDVISMRQPTHHRQTNVYYTTWLPFLTMHPSNLSQLLSFQYYIWPACMHRYVCITQRSFSIYGNFNTLDSCTELLPNRDMLKVELGAASMWEAADTHYTNCTTKQRQMGRSKQSHAAITQCGGASVRGSWHSLYWSAGAVYNCTTKQRQTWCVRSTGLRGSWQLLEVPSVAPYMPSCSGLQLPFDNFVQLVCKYVSYMESRLKPSYMVSSIHILLTACK